MNTLKPLFEEIAKERGSLVLSLYFESRKIPLKEMQTEEKQLSKQMKEYQHPGISQKRVDKKETQLVLNSPEYIDAIIKDVSKGYNGMVYDVFLADDSGKPFGRAWEMYDFIMHIDRFNGLCSFYAEIALSSLIPEKLKPKLAYSIREEGAFELKKRGLEDKIDAWNSLII